MVLNSVCKFLGNEKKISKKSGNEYNVVALLGGVEPISCMSEIVLDSVPFGQPLDCSFEYNVKFSNLKLIKAIALK